MNAILEQINSMGKVFVEFAVPMLAQSSVLIVILLLADFLLRKKVRAVFRYCIWMLVLVKLILPSSLSSPVSLGYWFGDELPSIKVTDKSAAVSEVNMSKMAEAASIEVGGEAPAVTAPMMDVEPAVAEAASQPVVTSAAAVTWQGVVFLVWLAVVGVMGLLLLQRAIFVSGLVAQAKKPSSLMDDALKYCCRCIGIRGKVGLKVSANATSPAVCGLFRPVILVPENLGPSLGAGGLRVVLIHELAHIKRGDLWVNLVQTVLQIIYFYNPLLWLANAVIRRVREQAVDETVQVAMGEKARQYPETLVNVAKLAFKRPTLSLRLIGVVESKSALKGRVRHMLSRPIPKSAKLGLVGLLAVIIIGAVLLPMAKAEKQKTEVRSQKTEFAATLPNGVTVELVGVCEHPSEGRQWWRPDGSLLNETPYKTTGSLLPEHANYKYCEFVIRLQDTDDISVKWDVPGGRQGSFTGNPMDANGQRISDLQVYTVNQREDQKTALVRIGLSTARWQTIATHPVEIPEETYNIDENGAVAFGRSYEKDSKTVIPITHNINRGREKKALRVVAVTYSGREVRGSVSGRGGNILSSNTHEFNLPLRDIKEFRFQTRPYEWVEFKNVSLKPGQITDVQVEVEGARQVNSGSEQNKLERSGNPVGKKRELSYDDGSSAGKWSFNDSGHAVQFETPEGKYYLKAVKIYGSRYGQPRPPEEDFHIWLCDTDFNIIEKFDFPYSRFRKGNPKWVTLRTKPTLVPEEFIICIGFNAGRTKGVYVHYDSGSDGKSFTALPGGQKKEFSDGDWMVRAVVSTKRTAPVKDDSPAEPIGTAPVVIESSPENYSDNVPPGLDRISVTFDQKMTDKNYSWVRWNYPFPETTRKAYYDQAIRKCTLPVKLEQGKAYLVRINAAPYENFVSSQDIPAIPYVLVFATQDENGNATPIPQEMLDFARFINSKSEQFRENPEAASKVSEADKMASENFSAEGWALWRQHKLAEAEEVFKKAVQKDATNSNAWNGLGWSQFNQGKPLNAKVSFEKCLDIQPKHAAALNGLGWIAKAQGKTDEAISHWEKAVEAAPGATAALNGLAKTYMELEQYDKAVKYYEMWLKVEPDNANAKAGLEKAKAQSQNVNLVSKEAEPADLQSLIDSARVGGTVIVPRGVYTEPIEINKSLTLKGESRADCVFEVTADKPAIFVDTKGKGRVTIEDITIKWQLATSDKNIGHRFAVAVKDTKADVKNCSFIPLGNFKRCPTAIQAVGFSRLSINACQFEGFEYTVCYGEGTEGTIQNCIVMDSGHQGISLYSGATAKIIGNVVTGSRYHAVRSTGGTLFMKDNLIINNANRGVYLGNKSARGTISNNVIMGNGTGIDGFAQSKVKIENNVIADSSYAGIGMRDSTSILIRNNIFQGNQRGWILFEGKGKGGNTSYRNTFWKNKVDAENFRKTANSIEADPRFVDPENGDFSLKPGQAKEYNQGLTDPKIFKTLWKRWQRREDKKP